MHPQNKKSLSNILTSFIGIAIFIILFIVGLVFFSYLLIIGGIIGFVLFTIAYLRAKFLGTKFKSQQKQAQTKSSIHRGRTIDHEK